MQRSKTYNDSSRKAQGALNVVTCIFNRTIVREIIEAAFLVDLRTSMLEVPINIKTE